MRQVRTILTVILWAYVLVAVALLVIYECGVAETGCLIGVDQQAEFIITTVMEILTLASIPLALRLFKFRKIHAELLEYKAPALQKWGIVRLTLLLSPMLINTILYYMYMNTAFGYLAIILVLCLPFVYPTMSRCLAETESES